MDIFTSTRLYEQWLRKHTTVVTRDLNQKHANMAENPFLFMRATYYRWASRFPLVCPGLTEATSVNAVRDLHIENFGTWRDSEGRLVWGVNDFDEAYPGPFTDDLVRLVASVGVAHSCGLLPYTMKDASRAIHTGYDKGLRKGASPFVLSHRHNKLRKLAESELRHPKVFWTKMLALPEATRVPASARQVLVDALPSGCKPWFKTRRAGQGSLGRQRFVALADHCGGYIAREAKALVPSAVVFAQGLDLTSNHSYEQTMTGAARSTDPFHTLRDGWIIRRLSPHCSRIELGQLKATQDGFVLLKAMGREAANVHAADPELGERILHYSEQLPKSWLRDAAEAMCADVLTDWKDWRQKWQAA